MSKHKIRQAIYVFHLEIAVRSEKQEIKIIRNLAQKTDEVVDEPAEEPIMGTPQTHDEEEVIDILKMVTMVVMNDDDYIENDNDCDNDDVELIKTEAEPELVFMTLKQVKRKQSKWEQIIDTVKKTAEKLPGKKNSLIIHL